MTGFLKDDETVTTCAVEKKSASPKPWMLLSCRPRSYAHIRVAPQTSTITESKRAMITRAMSRR